MDDHEQRYLDEAISLLREMAEDTKEIRRLLAAARDEQPALMNSDGLKLLKDERGVPQPAPCLRCLQYGPDFCHTHGRSG